MKHIILIIIISALVFSCEEGNNSDDQCAKNQLCTEQFEIVGVYVENLVGDPVTLDSTKVYDGNSDLIAAYTTDISDNPFFSYGFYPVATDSDKEGIAISGTPFSIRGWLKDQLVLDKDFLIGKDCCHIVKLAGVEKVILN
ncbi:MAG: hypothetical protein ACJA08_001259 [Cyclobacteriaceae bacterium]|jgi:hypothetical protein